MDQSDKDQIEKYNNTLESLSIRMIKMVDWGMNVYFMSNKTPKDKRIMLQIIDDYLDLCKDDESTTTYLLLQKIIVKNTI